MQPDLPRPKAVGFSVIKHSLDPAAKPRSRFRNPAPDRLQDAKHGLRVDCVDRLIENRPTVIIDRCAPLRRVYLRAPFTPLRFYEFIGALAEGSTPSLGFPGGLLCVQRVNALGEQGTVARGLLPRLGEVTVATEPSPASRCLPPDTYMKVQRRETPAPVLEIVR